MSCLKTVFATIYLTFGLLLISNQSFGSNVNNQVNSLLLEGNKFCKKGQYDQGMKAYTKALTFTTKSTPKIQFKLLLRIANVYASLQSFDRALKYYDLASEANNEYEAGEHPEVLIGYGAVAYGKGNLNLAQKKYQEAIQKAKIREDHRTVLTANLNIAMLMESTEKYDSALNYYKILGREALSLNDSISYCYSLWGQGDCLIKLSVFTEAESKLTEALKICKNIGANDRLSEIQGSMAKLKLTIQQYEPAAKLLLAEKMGKDSLLGSSVIDRVIMLEETVSIPGDITSNSLLKGSKYQWTYLLIILTFLILLYSTYYLYKHSFFQWAYYRQQTSPLQIVEDNSFNNAEFEEILIDLQDIMSKEKLYLDKELDIIGLAKSMKVNKNKLSKAINFNKKVNFKQYINDLRIDEAKKLLTDEDILARYTIESIALKCGFKTKVNFNYVFKQKLQKTPSEFISQNHN